MSDDSFIAQLEKKQSKFSMKRILIILLPTILIIGGGLYYFLSSNKTVVVKAAPALQSYQVKKEDLLISFASDGSIKNSASANVNFGMDGTVTKLGVKSGQKVKKGDVLGELDNTSLTNQVKKAQIDVDLAKANFDKINATSNIPDVKIAQQNLDNANRALVDVKRQNDSNTTSAQNAYNLAESNLEKVQGQITTGVSVSKSDLDQAQLDITLSQKNLDIAKSNADTDIAGLDLTIKKAYQSAVYTMDTTFEKSGTALDEINKVLELRPLVNGYNYDKSYNIKNIFYSGNIPALNQTNSNYWDVITLYDIIKQGSSDVTIDSDFAKISSKIDLMRDITKKTITSLKDINEGLKSTITTSSFKDVDLAALKTSFLALQTGMESQDASLVLAEHTITSTQMDKDAKILSDQNAVTSAENTLKTKTQALANLQTKQTSDTVGTNDQILVAQSQVTNAKTAIDNAKLDAESKVKSAEAQIIILQQQLETKLVDTKSTDLLTQEKQIESNQLSLTTAEDNLKNALLIAPIDGEVTEVNNKVGDITKSSSTTPVLVIVDKSTFEMDSSIEQADISKISVGQKVNVTIDAAGANLEGEVFYVSDSAVTDNNGIVTYVVKTLIPNTNPKVKAGMTASAEYIIKGVKNVLDVPVSAVTNKDGKTVVQLENKEFKEVVTGFTDGKKVEIVSGLTEQDIVLYK